ncbi:Copper amine oxidase N-terminal domain-containing protein [Gracilibacillus ureilyticus]|uniref:Copper amine oxidase N-terminal domain-containing protein n=1 Tax=Gracilibacillus ureilyticus TaxID=531814 RepID=A0A1H9VQ80_9BACI|nr:copper amine oxidase N-terminal domain-containing protein [Gracilibacillus ureilyticus]SES23742.1 Copper amine oxidase N-terminal domain-containing protein [Gracilibacillus ureilyticus]
MQKSISSMFIIYIISFIFIDSISAAGDQDISAQNKEYAISESEVYVDSIKVSYPVKPIIKDGTTLVPIRETFEAIGATVSWNQEEESVIATKGNTKLYLKIGSHTAFINEQPLEIKAAPVIYNSKTMIPLRLIGESFGGTVDYNTETKVISITMPKLLADFLSKEHGVISNIQDIADVKMSGDRRLMLSDNPENINANTIKENNSTLWNDVVKENSTSEDHRVVGWHVNEFNKEVTVGITLENLSETNTIEVRNLEGIHKTSLINWDYDIGLPVSEAVLNNRLHNIELNNNQANHGETIQIGSYNLNPGELIGFLNDFTVMKTSGTGDLNYIIRTVVSTENTDLTKIDSVPVPIDQNNLHPRGVWRSSELSAELPSYDVLQDGEQSYNISNGKTDNMLNAENSLVENAVSVSNMGHYGVVYKVKIPFVNESGEEKTIRVRLASRGGLYSGTVKTGEDVFNIHQLEPNNEVINVIDYKTVKNNGHIELDIMHSGGSYLPISININTVN